MRNIQLIIEYDGSRYDGWQKAVTSAKNGSSSKGGAIQEKIEEVLEKMEETKVELIGAIRTEAGVHAYRQVANFHTDSKKKTYEIKQYLNRYLPRDIAVLEALEVNDRFHASFNAKEFIFVKPEDYWWYCDLRRYGSCRHAGFGLGFERMVMYLTGINNIRDVELHPRTVGNAEF